MAFLSLCSFVPFPANFWNLECWEELNVLGCLLNKNVLGGKEAKGKEMQTGCCFGPGIEALTHLYPCDLFPHRASEFPSVQERRGRALGPFDVRSFSYSS